MSVLLLVSGLCWAAVHEVAYRIVVPGHEHHATHAPAGHGYLDYLPTSLALCLALALLLAAGALFGRRWRGASLRSLWLFGLVPVIGFVGHTVAEPLLGDSHAAPRLSSVASVALVGLLIQIPFALVALGFAREVLWLAEGLARSIVVPARAQAPRPAPSYPRPHASRAPAFRLDLAQTERGPPLLAA